MQIIYFLPILLLAALLFAFNIGSYPFFGAEEAHYAESAREMIETSNYLMPQHLYENDFSKSIFYFWEQILSLNIFGINEFAARFPSVLAGLAMLILAFILGNIIELGLLSSLILLSSLQFLVSAKLAFMDMSLCFFSSAAVCFFYLGYYNRSLYKHRFAFKKRSSSKWFIFVGLCLGLASLSNGITGLVFPLLVILPFLLWTKDIKQFIADTKIELIIATAIFLIMVLPWFIYMHYETAGLFTKTFFTMSSHSIKESWWIYVPSIFIGLMPWSPYLIQSISSVGLNINANSEKKITFLLVPFCLWWSIVILLFFSLSGMKSIGLILPIYLPLSIIIANWWHDKFQVNRNNPAKNLDAFIGIILWITCLLVLLYLSLTQFRESLVHVHDSALFMPIVASIFILVSAALIALTAILKQPKVAFSFLIISVFLSYGIASIAMLKPIANFYNGEMKSFVLEHKDNSKLISLAADRLNMMFYAKYEVPEYTIAELAGALVNSESSLGQISFAANAEYLNKLDAHLREEYQVAELPYRITNKSSKFIFAEQVLRIVIEEEPTQSTPRQ